MKLGTVGEYVYFRDKLLQPVVLDSLCEPVDTLVVLMVRSSCCVKLEVRMFDKQ